MISFGSFSDELGSIIGAELFTFAKVAFGPVQASKVLGVAKKLQLPKAAGRVVPTITGATNLKATTRDATRAFVRMGAPNVGEARTAAKEMLSMHPATPLLGKKPIIIPGKGALPKQINAASPVTQITAGLGAGPVPHVPAQQQKMLHGVVKGHELDEATVRGAIGAAHLGHRSPDVMYREHNKLVTMPPGNEKIQEYMRYHRGVREAPWMFDQFGLEYGKGPRLSRHARKRLTESVGRKSMAISNMSEEDQMKMVHEWNAKTPHLVKKYMGGK